MTSVYNCVRGIAEWKRGKKSNIHEDASYGTRMFLGMWISTDSQLKYTCIVMCLALNKIPVLLNLIYVYKMTRFNLSII